MVCTTLVKNVTHMFHKIVHVVKHYFVHVHIYLLVINVYMKNIVQPTMKNTNLLTVNVLPVTLNDVLQVVTVNV